MEAGGWRPEAVAGAVTEAVTEAEGRDGGHDGGLDGGRDGGLDGASSVTASSVTASSITASGSTCQNRNAWYPFTAIPPTTICIVTLTGWSIQRRWVTGAVVLPIVKAYQWRYSQSHFLKNYNSGSCFASSLIVNFFKIRCFLFSVFCTITATETPT